MGEHLASHIKHTDLRSDNTLHVVVVISNPVRYHSRYRLARECMAALRNTEGVRLHLVECAYGDRHHELVEEAGSVLRVRTRSEIWCKENLINLGVRHLLPVDWKYVSWVDGDITFRDPNWARETMHQLQHWAVLQPWMQCADLGFRGDIREKDASFGFMRHCGKIPHHHSKGKGDGYQYAHTGYAWACTRDFFEGVGGLMDWCVLGSADHHMAWAMVGQVDATINGCMHQAFFRKCREWQARATRACNKHVSYVNGRIEHNFHGPKGRRYYKERWKILVEHEFNPDTDLMYDGQGLIQLCGKPELEQAIKLYNRSRGEDSIEDG